MNGEFRAFTGTLPWNDWTIGETDDLKRLVADRTPWPMILEVFHGRFTKAEVLAKAHNLRLAA